MDKLKKWMQDGCNILISLSVLLVFVVVGGAGGGWFLFLLSSLVVGNAGSNMLSASFQASAKYMMLKFIGLLLERVQSSTPGVKIDGTGTMYWLT